VPKALKSSPGRLGGRTPSVDAFVNGTLRQDTPLVPRQRPPLSLPVPTYYVPMDIRVDYMGSGSVMPIRSILVDLWGRRLQLRHEVCVRPALLGRPGGATDEEELQGIGGGGGGPRRRLYRRCC